MYFQLPSIFNRTSKISLHTPAAHVLNASHFQVDKAWVKLNQQMDIPQPTLPIKSRDLDALSTLPPLPDVDITDLKRGLDYVDNLPDVSDSKDWKSTFNLSLLYVCLGLLIVIIILICVWKFCVHNIPCINRHPPPRRLTVRYTPKSKTLETGSNTNNDFSSVARPQPQKREREVEELEPENDTLNSSDEDDDPPQRPLKFIRRK